eukprot:586738-Hanusia_phi.AAC.2
MTSEIKGLEEELQQLRVNLAVLEENRKDLSSQLDRSPALDETSKEKQQREETGSDEQVAAAMKLARQEEIAELQARNKQLFDDNVRMYEDCKRFLQEISTLKEHNLALQKQQHSQPPLPITHDQDSVTVDVVLDLAFKDVAAAEEEFMDELAEDVAAA